MNNPSPTDNLDPDIHLFSSIDEETSSVYFTLEQFSDFALKQKNNFFLLNFNIRSFFANNTYFQTFLSCLPEFPNIVILTETWNTPLNVGQCILEGFNSAHTFRSESRGGGVSIFALNRYNFEQIYDLCFCDEFIEICTVKTTINDEHLIIIRIYHPPGSNIESFISSLELVLLNDFVRNKNVLVGGDMNINLNDINSTHVLNYISLFNSYMFMPAITKPTRFPDGV